jgi:hypothetical protein
MSKEPGQLAYEAFCAAYGWSPRWAKDDPGCKEWVRVEAAVRADERERCAKVCEGDFDSEMKSYGQYFAAAIRNLGDRQS